MNLETDKALAAGLIMGEGCIRIGAQKRDSGRTTRQLRVSIRMCDKDAVEWLHYRWPGARYQGKARSGRDVYEWNLYSRKAGNFLSEIRQYVIGSKSTQIDVALSFQSRKSVNGGESRRNNEAVEEFEESELKRLKSL